VLVEAAAKLIERLALKPHPEGGWYREVHRAAERVDTARGPRAALTTIYYLLEQGQLSRWHVVESDEVWHFYGGAPLELLAYDPRVRTLRRSVLASPVRTPAVARGDAAIGMSSAAREEAGPLPHFDVGENGLVAGAQAIGAIAAGVWQAARSLGAYSLVGCTVGPGFEFADFRFVAAIPGHAGHFTGELARYAGLL
jgi:hypothetical protein